MRLSSLAKLEAIELNNEAENLAEQINDLQKILANKNEQIDILKLRLNNLVKKYGDERKTELVQIEETKEEKAKIDIVPEDVVVVITHNGDIKRVPKKNFKVQHRKGAGIKSLDTAVLTALTTNTTDTLMLFIQLLDDLPRPVLRAVVNKQKTAFVIDQTVRYQLIIQRQSFFCADLKYRLFVITGHDDR